MGIGTGIVLQRQPGKCFRLRPLAYFLVEQRGTQWGGGIGIFGLGKASLPKGC